MSANPKVMFPDPFPPAGHLISPKSMLAILLLGYILCSVGSLGETAEPSRRQTAHSSGSFETVMQMDVPLYVPKVIRHIPHLGNFRFTEGLVFHGNQLFESTGWNYQTSLKKISTGPKGRVLQETYLGPDYFGEGLAVLNNKVYQLSYDTNEVHIYAMSFKKKLGTMVYEGQGWGLTHDSKEFIMSNGSSKLYFRDTDTFAVVREVDTGVAELNELEYVDGVVYANLWGVPYILMIDPASGSVIGKISVESLPDYVLMSYYPTGYTANGIAYDPRKKTFYITGKNWAYIYEVTFEKADAASRTNK